MKPNEDPQKASNIFRSVSHLKLLSGSRKRFASRKNEVLSGSVIEKKINENIVHYL